MKRKLSLLLVLVLVVSIFAVGCGGNDPKTEGDVTPTDTSLTDLQERGLMIVGCDDQFPPMGFVGDDNKLTGFDLELAALVAEKLGVTMQPQVIDWAAKEMELNSGNIDVIWNGYTINAERNEKVEYTKPYLQNEQLIMVKADSDIKTKVDLAGKKLGTQVESAGLDAINDDKEVSESMESLSEYDTFILALTDLKSNRLDAVVTDKTLINYVMNKDPGAFKVLDENMGDEYYGIGCAKGSVALREAIDKALDELEAEGKIDELTNKWFGENIVIRDVEKLTAEDLK